MLKKFILKKEIKRSVIILFIAVIINFQLFYLANSWFLSFVSIQDFNSDSINNMQIDTSCESVIEYAGNIEVPPGEFVTTLMLINNCKISETDFNILDKTRFILLRNKIVRMYPKQFFFYSNIYNSILNDLKYFPIPHSAKETPWINYVNSWKNERTYGGERTHEGTDIMAGKNVPGIYPVLSVSDGTVTHMGWLELGGYRIGITSENGIYYYYAHLSSYAADIKEGDKVTAGQFLGFMGNTGYSKVEGTSGKFDVHLHFGIYINDIEGNETAVNSYFFLKNLEDKVLYYSY